MSKVTTKTTFKEVVEFLKTEKLTLSQSNELINHFIKHINAFPLEDVISEDGKGGLIVNGKLLNPEGVQNFRQGISSLKSNTAFNLLADQVMYKAVRKGLHDSTTLEDQYFSKSALFFMDLLKQYIDKFD